MTNKLKYKNYYGTVNYCDKDKIFYGKIEGITDSITFEGDSIESIQKSFNEAVDDYVQICNELEKETQLVKLTLEEINTLPLYRILHKINLSASFAEAKRFIFTGAIKVNWEVITDIGYMIPVELFENDNVIEIRKGKYISCYVALT
jgi:ribosomal protein S4